MATTNTERTETVQLTMDEAWRIWFVMHKYVEIERAANRIYAAGECEALRDRIGKVYDILFADWEAENP